MRTLWRISPGTLAGVSAATFAGLYALAVGTHAGRRLDEEILNDALEDSALGDLALALVHAVNPITASVAGAGVLVLAFALRGPRSAIALAVALAGANASAVLLEMLLRDADPLAGEHARQLGPGFYPSGHMTAMMSIVLAAIVLAAPGRARARAALAGGLACGAVGVGNVVDVTHHPSDVAGGLLLATTWVAVVCALVPRAGPAEPPSCPRAAWAAALLALALGGVGAVIAAALDLTAAPIAGAAAVCALALALSAAVAALEPPG